MTAEEVTLDAIGLRCPLPVIRLAGLARDLAPDSVITVLTTDPAAGPDIAAWCRMRGHQLLDQIEQSAERPAVSGALVSRVRVGAAEQASR